MPVKLSVGVPVGVAVRDADGGGCESAGGIDGEAVTLLAAASGVGDAETVATSGAEESEGVCVSELDGEALGVEGELALGVSEPVTEGVCEGVNEGVAEPVSEGVSEGVCDGVAVVDAVAVALAVRVGLALALRHDTRSTQ